MNRFPIYIVSKGRARHSYTARALIRMGLDFRVVVEENERDEYIANLGESRILVLDPAYQRGYDTCDRYGGTKSRGPGPARNFVWDHAIEEGHDWHWVMDDNIYRFTRFHKNRQIPCGDGTPIKAMEDFTLRYENVAMAGPTYEKFAPRKTSPPPFITNTRIYSCNLIRNDVPFRWRARYNEDTDLSLRMLKAGWCTIEFYAFLQFKMNTQMMPGGNTDEFYTAEGTRAKSLMIARLHPDVARVVFKYGRTHHQVNYHPFRAMPLKRRADADIPSADSYRLKITPAIADPDDLPPLAPRVKEMSDG